MSLFPTASADAFYNEVTRSLRRPCQSRFRPAPLSQLATGRFALSSGIFKTSSTPPSNGVHVTDDRWDEHVVGTLDLREGVLRRGRAVGHVLLCCIHRLTDIRQSLAYQ